MGIVNQFSGVIAKGEIIQFSDYYGTVLCKGNYYQFHYSEYTPIFNKFPKIGDIVDVSFLCGSLIGVHETLTTGKGR